MIPFQKGVFKRTELVIDLDVAGEFVFGNLNLACGKATGFCKEEVVGKQPETISGLSGAGASAAKRSWRGIQS